MTQIGTFSQHGILTMARGRNGDLYGVNGLERGFRWNGVSGSVEQLGMAAPGSAPSVSPSAGTAAYYVRSLEVVDGGFGYTTEPTITVSAPAAGVTAKAKAEILGGSLRRIIMQEYGSGYTATPTVTVSAPTAALGGSGASLQAVMESTIVSVVRLNPGSGYTAATPPEVRIGHPCSGSATTDEITLAGHGLTDGDQVYFAFTAGGLSTSTPYYVIDATADTFKVSVTSGGSPETITASFSSTSQQVQPAAGKISGAYVESRVDSAGHVRDLVVIDGGVGHSPSFLPIVRIGDGSSATARVDAGGLALAVASVTVVSGGSNYLSGTQVRFVSRTGSGAAAEIVAAGGVISSVTMLQGGVYRSPPAVEVEKPARLATRPAIVNPVLTPGIVGRFWCAYRYIDADGTASNLSSFAVVDVDSPAMQLNWSNISVTEPRAAAVELWRTTADQALTLYRVATIATSATTYTDVLDDATLSNPDRTLPCTASASTDIVTCAGHGMFNGSVVRFTSLTGGAGLSVNVDYYVVSATATTFKVSTTKGGSPVDITTNVTAGAVVADPFSVLAVVKDDGRPNALRYRMPPQNKSAIVLFQDRAWYAVDSPGRRYDGTVDASHAEPNTLYYSEIDEPESVPETNELVVQDNVNGFDRIAAIAPFGGSLMVFQEQHCYRLTYSVDPSTEAAIVLVAQRGCLNQRCVDMMDGVAYVADAFGVYALDGDSAQPLSAAVENYWSDGIIDFSVSKNFFLRCDPATKIVRFHFAASSNLPDRALCYHPVTSAWWLEQYPQAVASAAVVRRGGRSRLLWGVNNGSLLLADSGHQDIDAGGNAQSIACQYRTGAYPFDIPGNDRRIRLIYKPTASDSALTLKLHVNNAATPRPAAIASDRGDGFTTTPGGGAEINLKSARSTLGTANGYAACYYAGRLDDRSAGGDRHLALDVSVSTPSDGGVLLYGLAIEGVSA